MPVKACGLGILLVHRQFVYPEPFHAVFPKGPADAAPPHVCRDEEHFKPVPRDAHEANRTAVTLFRGDKDGHGSQGLGHIRLYGVKAHSVRKPCVALTELSHTASSLRMSSGCLSTMTMIFIPSLCRAAALSAH